MIEHYETNRKYFLFESIAFIILGILAISLPRLFTFSIEMILGALLLVGGVIQFVRYFRVAGPKESPSVIVMALASIVLGILLLAYPITGIIALTLLISFLFLIQGITQIYAGLQMRNLKGYIWIIFSGIISLLLAAIIWSGLPGSATWVIGLLVGINMLIFGLSQLLFMTTISKK